MQCDAGKAHVLDAPEREREMPAATVLELLSLNGSETVIDYGAGTGRLAMGLKAHQVDAPFADRYTLLASAEPTKERPLELHLSTAEETA